MGARSRRKGHDFEREIARRLRVIFPTSRRGIQSRFGGKEGSDVLVPFFAIECKVGARPNIAAAMEQAIRDAAPTLWPTVISKRDREEPLVTMRLDDWLELVGAWAIETGRGT